MQRIKHKFTPDSVVFAACRNHLIPILERIKNMDAREYGTRETDRAILQLQSDADALVTAAGMEWETT
jgi:hypothetical protein